MSDSVTPCAAVCQASLSFTISHSLLKFVSIESVLLSNHLIHCHPLLLLLFSPASFPASGSFPVSRLFTAGGQNLGSSALASILPVNIQDWFPFWSTGLISLHSKELSGVFSTVVCAWAEKGFPDMRQNEREIKFITVEMLLEQQASSRENRRWTRVLSSLLYPRYKEWDRGLEGHLLIGWGTYIG